MSMLSVVIPAYNEEDSIAEILNRTLKERHSILRQSDEIQQVELIVVNDCSTDRTAEIVAQYHDVILINHERNGGYGAALKTGFQVAKGEYIAFLDADGTYPPEFLPALCRTIMEAKADIVLGTRMTGQKGGMPFVRRTGNRIFAHLLSWIVEQKITDTASGMRVFRKAILPKLQPLPDGLNLTPAMSTMALHENLKIVEISMPYDERVGRSKLSPIKDGIRFLSTIVGIAQLYNPLKFFGIIGCAVLLAAGALGLPPLIHYFQYLVVEEYAIYRLFTVMLLIVTGVNIITFGAFSNYVLSSVHGTKMNQSSIWARYLLNEHVMKKLHWIGLGLIAMAMILNHRTIWEYVTTREIHIHWSYILTGAVLYLVGIQLILTSFLIRTLDILKSRKVFLDVGEKKAAEMR